ncbi:MAG: class I SAM-dependent methyltransferase [Actinomycetota bacterium]|nr:class I SAM-dependent methyltransferase [Actinomycetota bacterium]
MSRADTEAALPQRGSQSIDQPRYWWFVAREELLRQALRGFLGSPERLLDVGSADGPSVGWLRGDHQHVTIDIDTRGLRRGEGVCASADAMPFPSASFDVVTAFDVVEHCPSEAAALSEVARVLRPGGRFLCSVPAYQWTWSDHDVRAGHYRRYTRRRITDAVERSGLDVQRATYGFTSVFPFFLAERGLRRVRRIRGSRQEEPGDAASIQPLPDRVSRALLGLTHVEAQILARHGLPFGSSVFVAALKPGGR